MEKEGAKENVVCILEQNKAKSDKIPPILTDVEAAWLAAAVDGEGYIGLYNEKPEKGKWPVLNVTVMNTNRNFVEYASKLMNTTVLAYPQTGDIHGHRGNKTMYKAEAKGHRLVLAILNQIRKYLIIKQEKADYIINFIMNRQWGRCRWPDDERKKRLSEISKKLWKTPEYRKKWFASMGCVDKEVVSTAV